MASANHHHHFGLAKIWQNPTLGTRLERVKQQTEKQIARITSHENTELVEVVHLFYDGYD